MNAYQWVSICVGVVAILTALFKVVKVANRMNKNFSVIYDTYRDITKTNSMLLEVSFVTLDGLKQLGCNGRVTEMHDSLLKHVVEKKEGLI